MKANLLLCLLFIVSLLHSSSAQSTGYDEPTRSGQAGAISFGPRIGTTFSTHHTPEGDGIDLRYKTGMQVGAVVNFGITAVFSIQPEVAYIQKGATVHLNVNESSPDRSHSIKGQTELRSNYLEVPVLGKATFEAGKMEFHITAGPTLGYWISGEETFNYTERHTENSETLTYTVDTENNVRFEKGEERFEVGANIGIGLGNNLGSGAWSLDIRYSIGFTDVYEEEEANQQIKNRVIGVSLAYLFGMQ